MKRFLLVALVALLALVPFGATQVSAQPSIAPDVVKATVLSWGQGCDGQTTVKSINNGRSFVVSFSNTGESPCKFNVPAQALQFGSTPGYPDGAFLVTVDWTNAAGINQAKTGATITNPYMVRIQLDSKFTQDLANDGHGTP